jgi:uncharacterized protein (DUF952 family)/uncharacterized glyoxalase superfamily protein PhnB
MSEKFPGAVPEIRVSDVARAALYYENCLGFHWDWGVEGLGQVSRGDCRIFLTDNSFRGDDSTGTPIVIWINLGSKAEVDALHESWSGSGAQIVAKPESQPWHLHEFTARDLDGNRFRVFYDFAWELPDRGGRKDDAAERAEARRSTRAVVRAASDVRIFHITSEQAWADAQTLGNYTADSLASEGFIHCSEPHQVAWVANQRFRGRSDLVLLHIDPARLQAPVRYENLEGGRELFPHVYGPVPVSAVASVTRLLPSDSGDFSF